MIKGIYLKNSPYMDSVNLPQVLSELNVLDEFKEARDEFAGENYKMIRREFWSDKFYIATYNISSESGYEAMWRIYDVLQTAVPSICGAWRYTKNLLIVAWPRYCEIEEDFRYQRMLEELIRFSTWCCREYSDLDIAAENVKDYFNMCVSYPENREL